MCQIALYCQCQKPGLLIFTWSTMLCSITNRIDLVILEHLWRSPKTCATRLHLFRKCAHPSCPPTPQSLLWCHYSKHLSHHFLWKNTHCIRFNLHIVWNPHMPILQEQFSCTACFLAITDWSSGRAAEPRWANQSSSPGVLTTGWREGAIPCQQLKL